jgi:hypothetical protein
MPHQTPTWLHSMFPSLARVLVLLLSFLLFSLILPSSIFHLPSSCFLLLASCFLLLASCFLLLASCFLLLASCFLLLASSHSLCEYSSSTVHEWPSVLQISGVCSLIEPSISNHLKTAPYAEFSQLPQPKLSQQEQNSFKSFISQLHTNDWVTKRELSFVR